MIDYKKDIVLAAHGVSLAPWTEEDRAQVVSSVADPYIWKYTTEALSTNEDVDKYVKRAIADRAAGTRYSFAIRLEGSESVIGSTSFGNVSAKDRRLEIGWTWLSAEYHGRGVNTAVKYLLLRYGFEELGAHRIEFKTDNANPRSCGALEKIGAQRDGVLRSHTLMHDGRYRDTVFYSVLESEWERVRSSLLTKIT